MPFPRLLAPLLTGWILCNSTLLLSSDCNGNGIEDTADITAGIAFGLLSINDSDFSLGPLVAADFNKDGRIDLASVSTGSSTVSMLLNSGNGNLKPPVSYDVPERPNSTDSWAICLRILAEFVSGLRALSCL
jgi:hypothetical protein